MTSGGSPSSDRLIFDASPLLHAARADRLDVLGSLVDGRECVTTQAVMDEIRRNSQEAHTAVAEEKWVTVVPSDSLPFLVEFSKWAQRMGLKDDHNIGEATLCAYASLHGGTVVMDDRDARRVARQYGVRLQGTLGLLAESCSRGHCTKTGASALVDALSASGMRLPFTRGEFVSWCEQKGLLP
ncbi:putative nucleic acid-binding protein [Murinocardiopsis flavida]|uniref:Putative nucleic acid-binding protein n=1 Tax=Murinocardiopsis flavida TaxID=645275 RepID=A0A2P8DH33_9ACTN|nr:hypothetical protein [Murinocardiopsis flavida]PSK96521.1 putative nucleic acid-binding protein [Murinocardiopsis flavida]